MVHEFTSYGSYSQVVGARDHRLCLVDCIWNSYSTFSLCHFSDQHCQRPLILYISSFFLSSILFLKTNLPTSTTDQLINCFKIYWETYFCRETQVVQSMYAIAQSQKSLWLVGITEVFTISIHRNAIWNSGQIWPDIMIGVVWNRTQEVVITSTVH